MTPGNYTFTVSNSSGCSSTATTQITINAQPTTPVIPTFGSVSQPTCIDQGSVQITNFNSNAIYVFVPSVGINVVTPDLIKGSSGTYKVVAEENGCSSDTVVLSFEAVPNQPVLDGQNTLCINETSQLSAWLDASKSSSALPNTLNPWVSSFTNIASVSNTGLVTAVSQGNTIITFTDDKGCQQSINVIVNSSPTKGNTISVTSNGPFCVNGTGVFTVSGGESNGSVKYKIDNGTEQIQVLDNLGSATINVGNITTSKSIVLTSIVTSSGCSSVITSATASATITINPT